MKIKTKAGEFSAIQFRVYDYSGTAGAEVTQNQLIHTAVKFCSFKILGAASSKIPAAEATRTIIQFIPGDPAAKKF